MNTVQGASPVQNASETARSSRVQKPSVLVLRLMDANLNRVAEGLRVVEDVLRFGLEDGEQCLKVRGMRHAVREAFRDLQHRLLSERDVARDPGLFISQQQGLDCKVGFEGLLLANLKRVQEGLRVLEESAHLLGERPLAKETEKLRFASYNLELELAPYLYPLSPREDKAARKSLPSGLYALTAERHSLGRSNLEVAKEILEAGVKILQYREKEKTQHQMYRECLELRRLTDAAGAVFIVNDHVELALAVAADGVHIGQDDLPLSVVRELVGPELMIGISTHSPEQAQAAVAEGADYIGVGPLYQTHTKTDVCAPVGLDYLRYVAAHIEIPFVAIGGIKEHNLAEVVRTGARTVALVTEIVGSPDITGKIRSLQEMMLSPESRV
ncbi:hypothetical protein JCM15765_44420 [Paradesulfitobacterium aromaticivorans]